MKGRGNTVRQWDHLGRWKRPGALHHIYQTCPIIFLEWAGQDVRWVHDNKGDVGLCPACEAASNKSYTSSLMSDAYLVGEYQRRLQAGVDAEIEKAMGLPE